MHILEFGRCEHILAFVGLDGVVYFGFFEEPEDALRAGFFEPVYFSKDVWLWDDVDRYETRGSLR